MIYWNYGISKNQIINLFLKISLIFMLFQILLVSVIVPTTQNYSRNLIKDSDINFFESFIKPKKFNDNINGLTIFADEKGDDGELKNIYLKKETEKQNFQITYAKSGFFISENNSQVLILKNGQTINKINDDITTFNFKQSTFNMASHDSGIIKVDKIQETSTANLIICMNRFEKLFKQINKNEKKFIQNCTIENLNNVFKELYKRFLVPFYIPTLILTSLILIIFSKETINYTKFRIFVFLLGFLFIVFSETTQKLIQDSLGYNLKIFIIPIVIFCLLYFTVNYKIHFKPKKKYKL